MQIINYNNKTSMYVYYAHFKKQFTALNFLSEAENVMLHPKYANYNGVSLNIKINLMYS